jgi:UDP-N-acetyl-D-mannosaminuronic acid dehydrogenase
VGAAPDLARLVRTAREVNDSKPLHVARQVIERASRFRNPTVVCLGLTFKANVDDMRESPAVDVVVAIADAEPDLDIRVVEPFTHALPPELDGRPNVRMQSASDAIDEADIVVLLVDHEQFKTIPKTRLEGRVVFDTRGAWR